MIKNAIGRIFDITIYHVGVKYKRDGHSVG